MPRRTSSELTWEQALAWRLGRHRLVERAAPSDLIPIVRELGGLHAQLMSSAELSLWARIERLEPDAVPDALWKRRVLVKLWAMRGTLHLLPSRELGLWTAALSTYTNRGMTGHPEIDRLTEAVAAALEARMLTRDELAHAVEEITGDETVGELVRLSWGSYLKPASFRGKLCFAPSKDGRVRLTAPATWLRGRIDDPDPNDALREVTRRFLATYAPATAADLALWWGGLSPGRGKRMLALLGDEAIEVNVEGDRAWVLTRDRSAIAAATPPTVARLLPAFDPWVVGASRTSPAALDPRHKTRVYRPQGWFSPVLLVDGRMVGTWKHTRKGRRLLVRLEPFGRLPAWARDRLEAEAERLAEFLGCMLELATSATGRKSPTFSR